MKLMRIVIPLLFIALLATPFLFRPSSSETGEADHRVIILTPHNEQIRYEFGRAFEQWLSEQPGYEGQTVEVIWAVPGGTSEIRTMLESQFKAALQNDVPPGGGADLMFGGGQYEHDQLKRGVTVMVDGERRHTSISESIPFESTLLDTVYGENSVGGSLLYDPEGYWFGTALSAFGILYNNDVLRDLAHEPPTFWRDLCHPALRGWVSLGNPAQSGSIRKSFDTIIQHHGWVSGWRILRRMGANARYFTASSSKVPIDVSQGNAAAGLCIDFYGRYQAQAIADAGDPDRLGYIDPPGLTAIDADPISLLRGAPNRDVAIMFIRFTLTEDAQALWQFPVSIAPGEATAGSAVPPRPAGPQRFELRRMPIRRSMYTEYADRFIDQVNPYEQAKPFADFNPRVWSFISLIFSSAVIDNHGHLRDAWKAIVTHPSFRRAGPSPAGSRDDEGIPVRGRAGLPLTAEEVADPVLREMLRLFDAMPSVPGPGGARYDLGNPAHLAAIEAGWLNGEWKDAGLWPEHADPERYLRSMITERFAQNYSKILRLAE